MLFARKQQIPLTKNKKNNKNNSSQTIFSHSKPLSATMAKLASLGRAASSACLYAGGSLTVETALVLPFFLLICLSLIFFCQIFFVHQEIQGGLLRAARNISENVLALETLAGKEGVEVEMAAGILAADQARRLLIEYSGDELDACSCLQGGVDGLKFYNTTVKDGYVDLIVFYEVSLPYSFGVDSSFPVVQRCRMKAWTGIAQGEQEISELVYITKSGTVYHKTPECSHIKLQIRSVGQSELSGTRNNNGGKYYPCEKCASDGRSKSYVYITNEGDRYHYSLSCSGLKRSVTACTKEEAEKAGMHTCKRCYGQ